MSEYGEALFPHHAELLRASAVSPEVARGRGYVTADRKKQLQERGFKGAQLRVPALVVPLFDVHGQHAGFQIRPDEPRFNDGGRMVKYDTPAKQPAVVDVHPSIRHQLGDPSVPLFVTEGVRKGDSAVSAGMVCVALLGVWNWRGTNDDGGTVALPCWESIALNGRTVYVVFDSDVMVKPHVCQALQRLTRFLAGRGAEVFPVYLPAGPDGSKVGLDDFIAAGNGAVDVVAHARDKLQHVEQSTEDTFDDVADESGAALLDEVAAFIGRFLALPSTHDLVAITLWVAHTWPVGAFESTPRLNISSAEKQSGKTRVFDVIELLVRNPRHTVNMTLAYMFRVVEQLTPTLLIDEADAIFNPKLGAKNEELRGLINAGHRRGATVGRMVGEGAAMTPSEFPVFAPVALAGIGQLPDTIHDRSVIIKMRRRKAGEVVEAFRERDARQDARPIARRLEAWGKRNAGALADARPVMPDGIVDRPADVWEPLLAVADTAGGVWPALAREACVHLNAVRAAGDDSFGLRLLADIRDVFRTAGIDRMASETLCEHLAALPEAQWGSIRGRPIEPRQLARWLKPYEVAPTVVRIGSVTPRGYTLEGLYDAFERYLPPETATSATAATEQVRPVADADRVALTNATPQQTATLLTCDVALVADVAASDGGATHAIGAREEWEF